MILSFHFHVSLYDKGTNCVMLPCQTFSFLKKTKKQNLLLKNEVRGCGTFWSLPHLILDNPLELAKECLLERSAKENGNVSAAVNIPWKCKTFFCARTEDISIFNATAANLE